MDRVHILITVGGNQYGVLEKFAEELKAGFENIGCRVDWLDVRLLPDWGNVNFVEYKSREYDFILVFNNWLMEMREMFVKSSKTIFWSFVVDSPLYHLERLQFCSENVIVSFIDKNHVAYAQRELKHLPYITFMPHGGSRPEKILPYGKRKTQVAFFGSYTDTKSLKIKLLEEKEPWDYLLKRVIWRLYEEEKDFIDILVEEADCEGQNFTEYQRKWVLLRGGYIYQLIRNLKRIQLLEILGAAGISVEVYGNGWNDYENKFPEYIHTHEAVGYRETLEIMADTKIVLSNMPLYANGSHERVFSAMRCGAVSFSEENVYFREEFEENREIVFFNYREPEKISEKIRFLLEHETLAEHIAKTGREKVERLHTWEIRAKSMLNILLQVKNVQAQQEKFYIKVNSECDEAWNRLFFQVQNMDEEMLYETMKAGFLGNALFKSATEELLEKSFSLYPYWGKLKAREGVFEVCRQRVYQMKNRMDEFVWLYGRLEDETSRKVLLVLLQHWLNCKSLTEMPHEHWGKYLDLDLIKFHEDEVFVDCGAYIGDTFVNFSLECKEYEKVYCYEPVKGNLEVLKERVQNFPNVEVRPYAVGEENKEISVLESEDRNNCRRDTEGNGRKATMVTLDSDIKGKITFLKADIEGAERLMLQGAKGHIQKEKPKLAVAVYHGNSDILDIPMLIENMNPDYKFYLRYYGGTLYPNEIVLYAT